jgi:hypothetical protein
LAGTTLILAFVLRDSLADKVYQDQWFHAATRRALGDMFDGAAHHQRSALHPLFALITFPIGYLITHGLRLNPMAASALSQAGAAWLWMAASYAVVRLMGVRRAEAVVVALVAALCGSTLFFFPVPGPLALGSLSVVLPFVLVALDERRPVSTPALVAVGTFSLSITVTNWISGILAALAIRRPRAAIKACAGMAALGVLLWTAQELCFSGTTGSLLERQGLGAEISSLFPSRAGALRALLLHAVVVPRIEAVEGALSVQRQSVFGHGLRHDVGVVVWIVLLLTGGVQLYRRGGARRFKVALASFVAAQIALHLVYGTESFLTAPHLTFALVLVAASACLGGTRRWSRWMFVSLAVLLALNNVPRFAEACRLPIPGPVGPVHAVIGSPNALDDTKSFVEPDGSYSPGIGSFGVGFTVRDSEPPGATLAFETVEYGLTGGLLIPWVKRRSGDLELQIRIAQAHAPYAEGAAQVVGAEAVLLNHGQKLRALELVVRVTGQGPAGGTLRQLAALDETDGLSVNGHAALVTKPAATRIRIAGGREPEGELIFAADLGPGASKRVALVAPVLPGRRVPGHRWQIKDKDSDTYVDVAPLDVDGGEVQPDVGAAALRAIEVVDVLRAAREDFTRLSSELHLVLPDARWSDALRATLAHLALAVNEGAPDVAVVNYNVYTRDAAYIVNVFQKAGQLALAQAGTDYLLRSPFSGRPYVESDAPGQVLWLVEQQWRFARDRGWLERVIPEVDNLAALIRAYRTSPGPHFVSRTGARFGADLADGERQELVPGRCDGQHPEYTFAFDIAGLRAAANLSAATGRPGAQEIREVAAGLLADYGQRFGNRLAKAYGRYAVLWPCRLYPLGAPEASVFRAIAPSIPQGWHYFTLAATHQALLAGNREAATGTLANYLAHPHVRSWFLLDEGGPSAVGGWGRVNSRWPGNVAMPHGWSLAELWLLMRDSLLFEDGHRLVLLAGVPEDWLLGGAPIRVELPTEFGPAGYSYRYHDGVGKLTLLGHHPPGGYLLRLPADFSAQDQAGRSLATGEGGAFVIPPDRESVWVRPRPSAGAR